MAIAPLADAPLPAMQEPGSRRPLLSVGITTADWLRMGDEIRCLEKGGADFLHIDVMDGCFCPQLTVGPPVISALRTTLRKDVHLMIEEPLEKVEGYVRAGAHAITVHVEASRDPYRVLQALPKGLTRGIALNPGTPLTAIEPLLDEADLVLVLAVNPGWRGQRFAAGTEARLDRVREMIRACGRPVMLGVDGGVTRQNVGSIAAMGVDLIVTGSAVFDGGDAEANLRLMLEDVGRATA